MSSIIKHPLREGIERIINKHFHASIAKRFRVFFEGELFNRDSPNIWKQLKDDVHIVEVHYKIADDSYEYICDIQSWLSPQQAEYRLMQYITDKVKAGKIGQGWMEGKDGLISEQIASQRFATPVEQVLADDRKRVAKARKEGAKKS